MAGENDGNSKFALFRRVNFNLRSGVFFFFREKGKTKRKEGPADRRLANFPSLFQILVHVLKTSLRRSVIPR